MGQSFLSSRVKLVRHKLPSSLANLVVINFILGSGEHIFSFFFFLKKGKSLHRILVQEMIPTQRPKETYTMCWRQARIGTVPHEPTEVRSQPYKLQIPVNLNGEIISHISLH